MGYASKYEDLGGKYPNIGDLRGTYPEKSKNKKEMKHHLTKQKKKVCNPSHEKFM